MSASPSPKEDVEAAVQSPPDDPDAQMNQDPGLSYELEVKEQDRWLPIANVARIMKMALPENAKIAKEAKECMQECVSEFISFITSEASEKCHVEKRKTVNGEDILFAMTSLGFENYAEVLKIYLSKYRETQSTRIENRPGSQGLGSSAVSGTLNVNTNTNAPSIFSGSDEPNNTAVAGVTGPEESKQESGFGGI